MFKLIFSSLIIGSLILFFSSSPYFGVFGVLMQAISLSLAMTLLECPFFGLLIILIYVGGLLVVFLFSTILSAEKHPKFKLNEIFLFWLGLSLTFFSFCGNENNPLNVKLVSLKSLKWECQFSELFGILSWFTIIMAGILLITLISILQMKFEHTRSSIRHI